MFRIKGSRSVYEDTIKVGKLKQLLRANDTGREEDILQFWEPAERWDKGYVTGRLRTIAVKDVVEVR